MFLFISGETGIRIERVSMMEKEIEKDEIKEDTYGKPAWLCFILQKKEQYYVTLRNKDVVKISNWMYIQYTIYI